MDKSIIFKILRDAIRLENINYPASKVLTVAHDNDRSLFHEARWYSPLVDTIEDALRPRGIECVSIARIISRIKGEVAYGKVLSPEGAFARALLAKRFLGKFARGSYPYSRMEEAIWGEILDKTGARKVFGIQPSREMCVACHKRGVWVADVQHGVIGDSHPWYGVAFRGEDRREWLPDAFILWDEGSAAVINRWAAAQGIETIVTGNRWVERFLRRRADDRLASTLFAQYEAKLKDVDDKLPSILVTLSWGNDRIPNGFLPDAMCEVIRRTSKWFNWNVRLHPNQLNGFATHEGRRFNDFFEKHLEGYVSWDAPTRAALPVVLSHSDLHISWNSSVSIEAAQMGIRTALLDPALNDPLMLGDYYEYYREKGMIDVVTATEAELMQWIEANVSGKRPPEEFGSYDRAYSKLLDFLAD